MALFHRHPENPEVIRLREDASRARNWKRWGPYLSERQWATVREDYSPNGDAWGFFPHDHARRRAYRWGEDGLLGITDRECRLCFALALWNGRDPILKERLFGLTGPEGNHGEDVKELYYYLDSTPTHSYMKALYKYPHAEFPYARLVEENHRRGKLDPEFEIEDAGVFEEGRYFDVFAEYAKAGPNDILIKITAHNRGPEAARLWVLPTLWFRNTWMWGCRHEGCTVKPNISMISETCVQTSHEALEPFRLHFEAGPDGRPPETVFTDNHTNSQSIWGVPNLTQYVKDAFHDYVIHGRADAVNPQRRGSKMAALVEREIAAGGTMEIRLRLVDAKSDSGAPFADFDEIFARRIHETEDFYERVIPLAIPPERRSVVRQSHAGLLWTKQFYHYVVEDWLNGDPESPPPPPQRMEGRNADWTHVYNRDVLSMPDKWEYPWYAAWDLAFHCVAFADVDPEFAKGQLQLILREWYMHPNGQIPAYEFALGDVNPPVHAWAAWRVYKMTAPRGDRDRLFLERVFQKLLLNFTWWVNRKDPSGRNVFSGGFLGLDNIGVFDRSQPLPNGGHLEQADGTAWMAFYCSTMLAMALELALENPAYEDIASKFFEHYVMIVDAMNCLGGTGLWDEEDGFYYDQMTAAGATIKLKVRSLVGLIPLLSCEVLEHETIERLPGFKKRMDWFLRNRADLARHISYMTEDREGARKRHHLLAVPSRDRLERTLRYMLDETEFLSPFGVRSLSRFHERRPFVMRLDGREYRVDYTPGESDSYLFGGNSNWRGPIWFPLNYLLVEALERYHFFYKDELKVEYPSGSGRLMNLKEVSHELGQRMIGIFDPDELGRRPVFHDQPRYAVDPHWRDLVLYYEYFHAETGKGLGASHQTGWTALISRLITSVAKDKSR